MDTPTLQQLRYLVAIADAGTFAAAAALEFVSQPALSAQIKELERKLGVTVLERSSRGALLTRQGAEVVVLYNGIEVGEEKPDMIDTLSLIKLGEHLEKLSAQDLRRLDTQVPLETLRAVVDLATEIGREGREGHPIGTMFVVGDTRKVMGLSRPMNFNPFRGYSDEERDVRNLAVREQIKDIAKLEGAIIIRRDGVAVAACRRIEASYSGFTLSMGLGTRHASAAAISKSTKAIAVTVSQSSGTVRVFQNGEVMLHIEPFARPMTWGKFRMDALEDKKS
jgi:DNA integrity scanning protein DisA with diadenylate cyclase activity